MNKKILFAAGMIVLVVGGYLVWQNNAKKKVAQIKSDAAGGKVAAPGTTMQTIAVGEKGPGDVSDPGPSAQAPAIVNPLPMELSNPML